MGNTSPRVLVSLLLNTLLCCGQTLDPVLTVEPNWSTFYVGEFVTFICDMNEGRDTDCQYRLIRNGQEFDRFQSDKRFRVGPLYTGDSGEFQCCRQWRVSPDENCSKTVPVTVSDKPRAKLAAGSSTIPVGGSVTLSCSVKPSAGWKYRWFRRTSDTSFVEFSRNNEENREITVTQRGIYKCDGKRGNPSFYSHSSLENIIEIMFSNKVFVTRRPIWPQMFSGESITLTCEVQGGETTEWTCEWKKSGSIIHKTDSKDWTFNVSESSSGNYMCQCRSRDDWYSSTQWSETIRLSVSNKPGAKLTAGSTTIPVGGSVTLSCSVEPSAGWKYRWFRRTSDSSFVEIGRNNEENREITVTQGGIYKCDGKRGNPSFYSHSSHENIIEIMFSNKVFVTRQPNWPHIFSGESITLTCEVQGGETTEWTCDWRRSGSIIHWTDSKDWTFNVSESSSGNYMCQCRSRDDWYSSTQWSETITVTVSSPVISSFPVMLIVGPVSGIVLIVLLLLLWRCRRSKDLSCIRSFQSESSSQRPTTNHGVNQTESDYSFLLHGTTSVYETIHNRGATGKERPPDPEEGSVYVNVRPDNFSSA
ncbi:leukocyte immunoglobulin-like receptor subfamily B member 3-like isoform X1 [Xiphophorus maculatus]|uniref:leukocyte immunoglobulin-like receptor subfamily B member 3-like isoform X1 n=1 Tax=Xiphophorus maculatus TaxID=8083 RepID=UPI000C6DFE7A|nr:leukocyte immunoglobulin-like receptor subfamily B member 3-like isoform X1 [Xiphophorus maculatus]